MHLPPPPSLKTTIIQLNKDIDPEDNNYEILNNVYNPSSSSSPTLNAIPSEQPKKKRRRSSSFVDDDELARRKSETKQLHSIIEKRRRVKINREFEALKYIIPACRNTDTGSKKASSNNSSKIDGMYKLTILKSSVEYILYLHHIIQKQHELLSQTPVDYTYDTGYTKVPIDVNQYRNIDKEFSFADLPTSTHRSTSVCESIKEDEAETQNIESAQSKNSSRPELLYMSRESSSEGEQLPSPTTTPDITPILSLLSKNPNDKAALHQQHLHLQKTLGRYSLMDQIEQVNKAFSYNSQPKSGSVSLATSPFTIPIKLSVKRGSFVLPDPAIPTSMPDEEYSSSSNAAAYPKRMYFKSQVPSNNMTAHIGDEETSEDGKLEDASKTLLLLRKPSIEKLLN
ncbi:hypothetical protein C7M61_000187 [Candidozyma pseudohaemuli]|uniref:BHLH domain-containing protein n=1 Tax=Candidozyma pseudohaemuli TaxID=418784 RepID=A0A2P7YX49_9ASCO|nr:hypothetical protein C7M61_000187 [[Candida] pseudohaemulonii]PSK40540.1 hypothetical protein C7M61_000187 [[Candida] pseudohaemulonii]